MRSAATSARSVSTTPGSAAYRSRISGVWRVAERAGLRSSAIRYYERSGLIPPAGRRAGKRVYAPGVLDRLAVIDAGKRAGFTLAELRGLLRAVTGRRPPGPRWRALARAKAAELDARIAEARRMKRVLQKLARCACPTLDDCGRALGERSRG